MESRAACQEPKCDSTTLPLHAMAWRSKSRREKRRPPSNSATRRSSATRTSRGSASTRRLSSLSCDRSTFTSLFMPPTAGGDRLETRPGFRYVSTALLEPLITYSRSVVSTTSPAARSPMVFISALTICGARRWRAEPYAR